jgi:uncharacterized protein YjbI with pentapeptide repeats
MANEEHLTILKQGVEVWNEWHYKNCRYLVVVPDLNESNLEGLNLEGANFWAARFEAANLIGVNLARTNLNGATFKGAKLQDANLSDTDLRGTNLKKADLRGVNLSRANLSQLNLSDANLSNAILENAELWHTELRKANFQGANLSGADLREANLNTANFTRANLSNAILVRTQALATNFNRAIFTGACLEDWHTNSSTNLDEVTCDYVYLKFDPYRSHSERCPHSGNFGLGEFTKLFQKSQEIVDLIFRDRISWDAFACAYKRLQIENEDFHLDIKTIDKRDGLLVITVLGIPEAYQNKWKKDFWQRYELALQALEARYQAELKAKDREIVLYERLISQSERTIAQQEKTLEQEAGAIDQQLGVINQLIEHLDNPDNPVIRDIIIYASQNSNAITNTKNQSSMSEAYHSKYDQRKANIGNNIDTVRDNARVQSILNNYPPEQRQSLVEAAAEIQGLLGQLEQSYPTSTPLEKQAVVTEAIRRIESNPTLKMRVIGALKKAGTEGIKELIDHPLINIFLAAVEGWEEP